MVAGLKGLLGGTSTAGGLMSKLRGNKSSAVAAAELSEGRRRKLVLVGASGLRNVDVSAHARSLQLPVCRLFGCLTDCV